MFPEARRTECATDAVQAVHIALVLVGIVMEVAGNEKARPQHGIQPWRNQFHAAAAAAAA